jgi:hypothetical protein
MSIFRKFLSALTLSKRAPQHPKPFLLAQYQLRYSALSEDDLRELRRQIKLYRLKGYHTQEIPLKEKTQYGCAGIVSCWNEGILEYRKYLMIRVRRAEKRSLYLGSHVKRNRLVVPCDFQRSVYPCLPPIDSKDWFL